MIPIRRVSTIILAFVACLLLAAFAFMLSPLRPQGQTATVAPAHDSPVARVMTIGGSIAHGWKALHSYGYLQRAFAALTDTTSTRYAYYDRTIVGADGTQLATMYKGRYRQWLEAVKPQIVVISWGLLNDALTKVTQAHFRMYLRQEIQQALSMHAVVFVVTPPVTKATYTQFKVQQPMYVRSEFEVVAQFHNPNVQLFDVFDQMKQYLTSHHQTYKPYMGDGWHPNTAGHILAGKLLYADILEHYKGNPIVFSSTPA